MRAIFGDRAATAEAYADLLSDEGTVRGLIGPSEVPRLWARHLLNSAVLGELIESGADVIDVGSGAGLPGIPLAIARPDLRLTLLEPLLRRSTWLSDVVGRLELENVDVVRGRAEEQRGRLTARYVTARAVAPLARLAGWCLPLLAMEGELLAIKGQSAEGELADSAEELRRLGARSWDLVMAGQTWLVDPTSVVRIRVGGRAS